MLPSSRIAAVALAFAASCGSEQPAAKGPAKGADLYASQGCGTCHGADGGGAAFGPSLHGKKQLWTREKLVAYLKDPAAYGAKDARLTEQSRKFTLPMQRFDRLKPEELEALADHVLAMP